MLRSILNRPSFLRVIGQNVRSMSNGTHVFEKIELKKRGGEVLSDDIRNKVLLLFFSAEWCPSCREFTPMLKEFYENTKSQDLQVVWLSRDRSEEDQLDYYNKSLPPWLYIPFGSTPSKDFLELYKIQTIPAIKLIASNGEVADDGVRVKIEKNYSDAEKCKEIVESWKRKLEIN